MDYYRLKRSLNTRPGVRNPSALAISLLPL